MSAFHWENYAEPFARTVSRAVVDYHDLFRHLGSALLTATSTDPSVDSFVIDGNDDGETYADRPALVGGIQTGDRSG